MTVANAFQYVGKHIAKHTGNKYQHSVINADAALKEPKFTLLTAQKYLARYLATSGEKTGNIEDLAKAVHFIMFEIENKLENHD